MRIIKFNLINVIFIVFLSLNKKISLSTSNSYSLFKKKILVPAE